MMDRRVGTKLKEKAIKKFPNSHFSLISVPKTALLSLLTVSVLIFTIFFGSGRNSSFLAELLLLATMFTNFLVEC